MARNSRRMAFLLLATGAMCAVVFAQPVRAESAVPSAYAAMSEPDRVALQSDLTWAGFYNGAIDGDFGARSVDAVKAFQKSIDANQSGVLEPRERERLAEAARAKHSFTGWTIVTDPVNGIRLGIPKKIAPHEKRGKTGSHWSSAQGQIQIETWRVREAGLTIAKVAARERGTAPKRQVNYQVVKDDFFVLSGLQGLKNFYVRAHIRNGEVRGLTILYDQATEGFMEPVVIAMSSAFSPFASGESGEPVRAALRKVEYASGIVAGLGDVVITERNAVEACQSITVPGLGGAERIATDKSGRIALLRVYGGARGTAFDSAIAAPAQDYIATGIADPQKQNGGRAITTAQVRAETRDSDIKLAPAPLPGFSGAAVTTAEGRFAGMLALKPAPAAEASDGKGGDDASLIPAGVVREFLTQEKIPLSAPSPGDLARSIVRVICVRR